MATENVKVEVDYPSQLDALAVSETLPDNTLISLAAALQFQYAY